MNKLFLKKISIARLLKMGSFAYGIHGCFFSGFTALQAILVGIQKTARAKIIRSVHGVRAEQWLKLTAHNTCPSFGKTLHCGSTLTEYKEVSASPKNLLLRHGPPRGESRYQFRLRWIFISITTKAKMRHEPHQLQD